MNLVVLRGGRRVHHGCLREGGWIDIDDDDRPSVVRGKGLNRLKAVYSYLLYL